MKKGIKFSHKSKTTIFYEKKKILRTIGTKNFFNQSGMKFYVQNVTLFSIHITCHTDVIAFIIICSLFWNLDFYIIKKIVQVNVETMFVDCL